MNNFSGIIGGILFLSFLLFACNKDEGSQENNDEDCSTASLSCIIDGVPYNSDEFNNTMTKLNDPNNIATKKVNIIAQLNENIRLILTFSDIRDGFEGNCMTEETYFQDILNGEAYCEEIENVGLVCNGFGPSLFIGDQLYILEFGAPGFLDITDCDPINQTLSGNFEGFVENFSTSETIEITNGVFENVCYIIQ